VSGVAVNIGTVQLKGMALATVFGMSLSLLFFVFDKLGWSNDAEAGDASEKKAA
jgi:uracil permease